MGTQRILEFLTSSQYSGTYNQPLHCMDGYGIYKYPDGSQYHGHFRRGRFHGLGRLTLAPPYSFTFVGEFDDGELVNVNQMMFADGLMFNADFIAGELKTDIWHYLSKSNRLYTREICMGLLPVAPHETFTSYHERTLAPNTYDAVEGIYMERTNFITQIPEPFNAQRHVTCQEADWIRKHCVRPDRPMPIEPDEEWGRAILANNIKVSAELREHNLDKEFNSSSLHQAPSKTFSVRPPTSALTDDSKDYREAPSSISVSSLSNVTLEIDLDIECVNQVRELALKNSQGQEQLIT